VEPGKAIGAARIVYFGMRWGAALGAILPAVESRTKANVLVAGFHARRLPDADGINYVTRVRQPM
jgi:hypothetical protein